MKRLLTLVFVVTAMALVACNPFSSDDDGDSTAKTVENYWPLAVGNYWTLADYEDGTATGNGVTLTVTAKEGDWYTVSMQDVGEPDAMILQCRQIGSNKCHVSSPVLV